MAVQAGLLNAQIPMSAKPASVDGLGSYMKGAEAKDELADLATKDEQRQLVAKDHAVITDYLSNGGGDLYTPDGQDKAVKDLKGKISSQSYMGLVDHANKAKAADVKMREDLAKLTHEELANRQSQLDQGLSWMAQPLEVYYQSVGSKGTQGAQADFDTAKSQIVASMAQGKNIPPDVIQQIQNANPDQLKAMLTTTKYQQSVNLAHLQESQIKRNEALSAFDEARAKATESGGLSRAAPSEIGKIDADVKAGRITPEQGKQMVDGIVAKKAKGPDVSSLSPDALERAATDYYIDRTMPARLNAFERSQIMNKSAEMATQAGDNAEAGTIRVAANKASKAALMTVTRQEQMTSVFERDAEKRLGLVLDLAKKADLSGSPALNRWIAAGRTNIEGDVDVNNLNSAMISLQAELAKVLSGSLGNAGVSDAARAEAGQIINRNMSPEMLDALAPNIRKELKFKLDSFKEQRAQLTDSLKVPGGGPALRNKQEHDDPSVAGGDKDRAKILSDEYKTTKAKYDAAPAGDGKERLRIDLDKITKEAKASGVNIDGAATPSAPAAAKPKTVSWSDLK